MSKSIVLRHCTPRQNTRSILNLGIDPSFAQQGMAAVWLHSLRHTEWAIKHTEKRHHCKPDDQVIITVRVPRSWLTRRKAGLWTCERVIPASKFKLISPALALV